MLNDLAAAFLSPFGVILLLLALAYFRGQGRAIRTALALATIAFWLSSTPLLAYMAASFLESQYPPKPLSSYPASEVIIVLGGGTAPHLPPRQDVELGEAADRLLLASDLVHAGKAPRLLLSGGRSAPGDSEAQQMLLVLERLGVDPGIVLMEEQSLNTAQNAHFSVALARREGIEEAILVTSSLHMPRAVATFRRAGLAVVPAATDVIAVEGVGSRFSDWLPNGEAFAVTTRVAKELVGFAYYNLRGWI